MKPFKAFFEDSGIEKIGHNLKYDLKVLRNYGVTVKAPYFDTMVAHYLVNPDMRHNMDILAETYLNYSPQPITDLIGKKGKSQGIMRSISLEKQTEYAVEDADITLQLKYYFKKEMEDAGTLKLFQDVELPLVEVLTQMECEGINLDTAFLKELSKGLSDDIQTLEKTIYKLSRETFNLSIVFSKV